jgi:diadenosine tetraphosphate (Ap4A) HIT family hydrolase
MGEGGGGCVLCQGDGGRVLWRDEFCRVVLADEPDYPGFCRVILQEHVKEMTDLAAAEQQRLMAAVFAVEAAVREILLPDKINLASLGNQVPHLHWHVIPRFTDDSHFPSPIWAPGVRERRPGAPDTPGLIQALSAALSRSLGSRA